MINEEKNVTKVEENNELIDNLTEEERQVIIDQKIPPEEVKQYQRIYGPISICPACGKLSFDVTGYICNNCGWEVDMEIMDGDNRRLEMFRERYQWKERRMAPADYINSKDIREYLRDYPFTPIERAWLIYQCKDISIAQKHAAWNELIETTEDCAMLERRLFPAQSSLHAFLCRFMELQNEYVEDLYRNSPNAVYELVRVTEDGEWNTCGELFSSLDAAYEYANREYETADEIVIAKHRLDEDYNFVQGYFRPGKILMDVTILPPKCMSRGEADEYSTVFRGLWFEFPTPFKKGDIIWDPGKCNGYLSGPFVMTGIGTQGLDESAARFQREDGDNTDMNARGYFRDMNGLIYDATLSNYMDCEYYDKELTDTERALLPISRFYKGKIDKAELERLLREAQPKDYVPLEWYLERIR